MDAASLISKLHWLPIKQRLSFKLLLMVYKCLHGISPPYLSDVLTLYQPGRSGLRSSDDKLLLSIPTRSKSFGDRSFSIAGPKLWNSVPINIRNALSVTIFRNTVKRHYNEHRYTEHLAIPNIILGSQFLCTIHTQYGSLNHYNERPL